MATRGASRPTSIQAEVLPVSTFATRGGCNYDGYISLVSESKACQRQRPSSQACFATLRADGTSLLVEDSTLQLLWQTDACYGRTCARATQRNAGHGRRNALLQRSPAERPLASPQHANSKLLFAQPPLLQGRAYSSCKMRAAFLRLLHVLSAMQPLTRKVLLYSLSGFVQVPHPGINAARCSG